MSNKTTTIGLVIVAVLAIIGIFTPGSKTITNVVKDFGAMPYSTNFTSIGLGVNDSYVQTSAIRQSFLTGSNASTTPCSILSPNATTSLVFASAYLYSGTTTVMVWDLATSTDAFSTTTKFTSFVTPGGQSTPAMTFSGSNNNATVGPNTYIVWKVGGPVTTTITGNCQAVFTGLQ